MASKEYLYAVQRATGHEVVSYKGTVARVGDIAPHIREDGKVELRNGDEVLATSEETVSSNEQLNLLRWDANEKLEEPVAKVVQEG